MALIEAGADVNARNEYEKTPLMFSVTHYLNLNPEVITTLLSAGADPRIRDNDGMVAIEHAGKNEALRNTEVFWRLNDASF